MGSEKNELNISKELTEIFRRIRIDMPQSTSKIDAVWDGLQMVVAEIKRAAEGKSSVRALNGMDPADLLSRAERAAFKRLNDALREDYEMDKVIDGFIERSEEILKDDLIGIYLHGSYAMGCFNVQKSDIDLIIVAERPLSDAVKRKYLDMVVEYNAKGPAKGIEMSIVLREVCKPFVYPTPFELHFSAGHLEWYQEDPDEYIKEMRGEDKDLASHFTIINKRGRCLYGPPIKEVFAEVPADDYMDSIWFDVEEAEEHITEDTMYLTLNLARVLAYKEEGLVLSKMEGGDWALEHMPEQYHQLILDALREYADNAEPAYDEGLAKSYAAYVIGKIRD